jgi:hypothetical protein
VVVWLSPVRLAIQDSHRHNAEAAVSKLLAVVVRNYTVVSTLLEGKSEAHHALILLNCSTLLYTKLDYPWQHVQEKE